MFFFFLMIRRPPRSTLFPTRRSSDLEKGHNELNERCAIAQQLQVSGFILEIDGHRTVCSGRFGGVTHVSPDRKSTRLNSSHLVISYAVFCLKKKKKQKMRYRTHHANI